MEQQDARCRAVALPHRADHVAGAGTGHGTERRVKGLVIAPALMIQAGGVERQTCRPASPRRSHSYGVSTNPERRFGPCV
jgi:hypothetical protein